jgi:hypothetical protein
MSDLLTHSYPGHAYPDAHSISQQTAHHLRTYGTINSFISVPFLTRAESPEVWATYEKLFISCLETGDDESAHQCLEKLIARFGATNERIMGLRGLYQEAVAEGPPALEKILKHYDDTLAADPANIVSHQTHTMCHFHSVLIDILSQLPNGGSPCCAALVESVKPSPLS